MNKMLIIVLCITFCVVICTTSVMADEGDENKSFIGYFNPSSGDQKIPDVFKTTGLTIINILQIVGTIFAIAMLLYLGIKLLLASPSQRADIKSRAVPYIVGSVMLFSIVGLLTIVYNVMSKV